MSTQVNTDRTRSGRQTNSGGATAVSSLSNKVAEVASTSSWEELPFAAAVKSTAGSPGRLKTSSI